MFRAELERKLKSIFGMSKVTFDAPGETLEQNCLFIEIQEAPSKVVGDRILSKVQGSIFIFAQQSVLPFGFFTKRVASARHDDKKDLFFSDWDTSALNIQARQQNLAELRTSFVYLHSAQHDPNKGELSGVEWTEEFTVSPLAVGDGTLIDVGDGTNLGTNT